MLPPLVFPSSWSFIPRTPFPSHFSFLCIFVFAFWQGLARQGLVAMVTIATVIPPPGRWRDCSLTCLNRRYSTWLPSQSCQPLRFGCSLLRPRAPHYAATLLIISLRSPPQFLFFVFDIVHAHGHQMHQQPIAHVPFSCLWCWLSHSQLAFVF